MFNLWLQIFNDLAMFSKAEVKRKARLHDKEEKATSEVIEHLSHRDNRMLVAYVDNIR